MAEILIVEDDTEYGHVLTAALKDEHRVSWVEDGQRAVDEISQRNFDLVLLDLRIPKVNGISLYNLCKKRLGMRVVISSGFEGLSEDFPDSDGILQKPYSVMALKGMIREVLSGKSPKRVR